MIDRIAQEDPDLAELLQAFVEYHGFWTVAQLYLLIAEAAACPVARAA